jgi:hypothetical protein
MLVENVGKKCGIIIVVKPNALLINVVEDLIQLGKNVTKLDYTVIVGGPGTAWIGFIITE